MNGNTRSALRATLEKEDAVLRERLPAIDDTVERRPAGKAARRKPKPEKPKAGKKRLRRAQPESAKSRQAKREKAKLDKRVCAEVILGAGEQQGLKRLRAELKRRGVPVRKSVLVRAAVSLLLGRCSVAEVAVIVAGLPALEGEGRAEKDGRKGRRAN